MCRAQLLRRKAEQGINDNAFYHLDTPLTMAHGIQALREAGFGVVEIFGKWGQTCTIKAGE